MSVENEFDRVRMALRAEEEQLARELERIDAAARASVEAAAEHARTELATQADRIREAIAQHRVDVWAQYREPMDDVRDDESGDGLPDEGPRPGDDAAVGAGTPAWAGTGTHVDETAGAGADVPDEVGSDDAGRDHEDGDPAADGPVVEGPADHVGAPDVEHVTSSDDSPGRTVGDTERGD